MPELKIPQSYLPKSGGGGSNEPATFEREIIKRWKEAKNKAGYQAIIDLIYSNQRMNSYEFVIASLTLEKK